MVVVVVVDVVVVVVEVVLAEVVVVVVDPVVDVVAPLVVVVLDDVVTVGGAVVDVVVVVGGRVVLVLVVVLVASVVVVGGGGQVPSLGMQVRTKRSTSVPRPRAFTRIASRPGRWRSSGPRTGTVTAAGAPQAEPTSVSGTGTSPLPTVTLRSDSGGWQPSTPWPFTQTRTVNWHVPSHIPSASQFGSPSTHDTLRGAPGGGGLSTSSRAKQSVRRGPPPGRRAATAPSGISSPRTVARRTGREPEHERTPGTPGN